VLTERCCVRCTEFNTHTGLVLDSTTSVPTATPTTAAPTTAQPTATAQPTTSQPVTNVDAGLRITEIHYDNEGQY
jgi:hypothetical protein